MINEKIKHLEFIQRIIERMARNSFLLKGWSITLSSGLLLLKNSNSAIDINKIFLVVIIFYLLDSYYLGKEKQFRDLYDNVRKRKDTDFSLHVNMGWKVIVKKLFSIPNIIFYLLLALLLIINFSRLFF